MTLMKIFQFIPRFIYKEYFTSCLSYRQNMCNRNILKILWKLKKITSFVGFRFMTCLRKIMNSSSPINTLNLQLHVEQFSLGKNLKTS